MFPKELFVQPAGVTAIVPVGFQGRRPPDFGEFLVLLSVLRARIIRDPKPDTSGGRAESPIGRAEHPRAQPKQITIALADLGIRPLDATQRWSEVVLRGQGRTTEKQCIEDSAAVECL